MEQLDEVLRDLDVPSIDRSFFVHNAPVAAKSSDYQIRGYTAGMDLPNRINFRPDETPYAIILRFRGDIDIALAGFTESQAVIDCLQIQGRRGCYRELTPLRWGKLLLQKTVDIARAAGADAVRVVSGRFIDTTDAETCTRLIHRYDENAASLGFRFSEAQNRYVLDLKKDKRPDQDLNLGIPCGKED